MQQQKQWTPSGIARSVHATRRQQGGSPKCRRRPLRSLIQGQQLLRPAPVLRVTYMASLRDLEATLLRFPCLSSLQMQAGLGAAQQLPEPHGS